MSDTFSSTTHFLPILIPVLPYSMSSSLSSAFIQSILLTFFHLPVFSYTISSSAHFLPFPIPGVPYSMLFLSCLLSLVRFHTVCTAYNVQGFLSFLVPLHSLSLSTSAHPRRKPKKLTCLLTLFFCSFPFHSHSFSSLNFSNLPFPSFPFSFDLSSPILLPLPLITVF